MNMLRSLSLLRIALLVDAVASGAMGIGLLLFGAMLAPILQLPAGLLAETGMILVPFAAFVGFLASRIRPNRIAVWTVIAINVIWVIDSVVLLLSGWVAPNLLGYAFVLVQAAAVAVFAELQYLGLGREGARSAQAS